MGIWTSLFGTGETDIPRGFRTSEFTDLNPENPSTPLSNPAAWLYDAMGAAPSYAGPSVSESSAMRQSAVYACVALKAGLVGSLPIHVYKITPKGRQLADDHRLYPLLLGEPSDLMSAFTWKELIETALLLNGNHLSVIERDGANRYTSFVPVQWSQVTPARVNGRNRYTIRYADGTEVLDQDDVLHVPGIGFDGLQGMSPIAYAARQPVGIALAMEEALGRLYGAGMRPGGVFTLPKGIQAPAAGRMKSEIEGKYSGLANAGRPIFLDADSKYEQTQMTPADAQTIDSRRFQVADICRIMGVPPHMVGETDKTTSWGTGIEQQTIGFLQFSLGRDLRRIEAELNRKLLQWPYYCEFDRDALLSLDASTQAQVFSIGVQNARYTPNEVRRKSNLPDVKGGDSLYIQGATVPLELAGKVQAGAATPPSADAPKKPVDPGTKDE